MQKQKLSSIIQQLQHKMVRGGGALDQNKKKEASAYRQLQLKLKKQKKKQKQMIQEKLQKEQQLLMVEQNHKNLQQQCEEGRKTIKKLRHKYQAAVDEIKDLDKEHQRDREDLLDNIRDSERQFKLFKGIAEMMLNQDDLMKIKKRCAWNESDGEWTIPHFMFKNKKISFPNIKNAESLIQNHKDGQDLEFTGNQVNKKTRSKWSSEVNSALVKLDDQNFSPRQNGSGQNLRVDNSRGRISQNAEYKSQMMQTKYNFQQRDALINKFSANLQNGSISQMQSVNHPMNGVGSSLIDPSTISGVDISLSKESQRVLSQLKPKLPRGKVQLEPIANVPGITIQDRQKIFKNSSNASLNIPEPKGHRVGSLQKIQNPPHLQKMTKIQPIGVGQNNNRIDFSFKATFVLEHQGSGENRSMDEVNEISEYKKNDNIKNINPFHKNRMSPTLTPISNHYQKKHPNQEDQ